MNRTTSKALLYGPILVIGLALPFFFPFVSAQVTVLWVMILFALTWDILGGQMGYNSLGNITFFGVGMYVSAVVQIGLYYNVGEYTAAYGGVVANFQPGQYYTGLALGIAAAAAACVLLAILLGLVLFGLRGPYFAIGTLGVVLAAGELVGAWDWLGGGGGIAMPTFPGQPAERARFFYMVCFGTLIVAFVFLRWLYSTRFSLAVNAIRDDEEKAEAMGIHTLRHKLVGWAIAAFFLGIIGAVFGNLIGFIEPLEVAFPAVTFGIFMVVMSLLGGKGTLWGPVIGATLFHIVKELTWTYMLGWQWVALGVLIIINVVYFQQGILGWVQAKRPHWFGIRVEETGRQRDGKGKIVAEAAE
ncbi:MAG TPA: branched-chain amino acid ABC transporter permease [Alphaproteobacteria bacterium]|nr:branched-chain amino acid ABC transporter permease [Alphaproteobacteria bacterium]